MDKKQLDKMKIQKLRLIDANALKESLKELKVVGNESYNHRRYIQGLQDAVDDYFTQIIDDAPTIDAVPIKHGKWMYRERTVTKNNVIKECFVNPGGYTVCYVDRKMKVVKEPYCSECDWHGKEDFEETSFCPNCGAIMDL